jgi:hypothetical protein
MGFIAPIIAIVAEMFLCTMSAVLGVIDIEPDDLGWTVVGRNTLFHQHQRHAINSVHETLFSQRDIVGWEAKGVPVSGNRSRRSVQRGSWRKVLASFASS